LTDSIYANGGHKTSATRFVYLDLNLLLAKKPFDLVRSGNWKMASKTEDREGNRN